MMQLFRREAVEHQRAKLWGDVIIIQPTSYHIISALFLVLFILAGVFLAGQSYSRKETVQGFLSPKGGMANVYADRGGVVSALYVTAGSHVTKGQKLAELMLDRRLPSGLASATEYEASLRRDLAAVQKRRQQVAEKYQHDIAAARDRLAAQKRERAGLEQERAIAKERIGLAESQYDAAARLAKKGYAAQRTVEARLAALLELRQMAASTDRQIVALDSNIQTSETQIASTLPAGLATEQDQLRAQAENLGRELANAELSAGYVITAPTDGIVTSLRAQSGMAAQANVPLLAIRPAGSPLVARLLVPSRAAGMIAPGQATKIEYDAFPYQRFGIFGGTVSAVSESVVSPGEMAVPIPMHEAFYVVDVKLENQAVHVAGKDITLKPGMLLKADIRLEKRSLLQWIFDPILAIRGKL